MRWFVMMVCVLAAAPAAAQSTYVGASVTGDIVRFGKVETEGAISRALAVVDVSRDGEAIGFGVTAGRALGERWGVELEFARSGEIENEFSRSLAASPTLPIIPGLILPTPFPPLPGPDIQIETETELRLTTLSALLWARQELGERVELAFLGGVSFIHSDLESRLNITGRGLALIAPFPLETTSTEFHTGPAAGVDAIIKFGDRTAVVAGVRLIGLPGESLGGWLIRPSAGVRWRF